MRFLGKNESGQEIWGYDFKDPQIKKVSDMEIELIGSTEDIDRDGEVIKMDGWDLRAFKKNPVVLPSHMYWEPPIGKAKVSKKDNKLIFKIEFPPEGDNPVADIYRKLYKGGFMHASSVGFIPLDYEWGQDEKSPRRTILKQELLEISLVSVPANPQALVTEKAIKSAMKKGTLNSQDCKELQDFVRRVFDDKDEHKLFVWPKGVDDDNDDEGTQGDSAPQGDQDQNGQADQEETEKAIDEKIAQAKEEVMVEVKKMLPNEIRKHTHYFNEIIKESGSSDQTESINRMRTDIKSLFTKG